MTNTEAIRELEKFVRLKTSQKPAFLDVAIEALEKQIPEKPTILEYNREVCPVCGEFINDTVIFCPHCGQAIDWRNADDSD